MALGEEMVKLKVDDYERAFRVLSSEGYEVIMDEWVLVRVENASKEIPKVSEILRENELRLKRLILLGQRSKMLFSGW